MGTRADFYILPEDREVLEPGNWLGSIAWDGYPAGLTLEMLGAEDEESFIDAFEDFAKNREDFTSPNQGCPWPWDDSVTTDYYYIFDAKKEKLVWNEGKVPKMSKLRNVNIGKRSGLIVVGN